MCNYIPAELKARPNDVHLRVKLLKHYMSKNKYDNAYEHAIGVEATHVYRNSIVWYQTLCELLTKCKEAMHSDWSFWMIFISALERCAALSLKEQGSEIKKTVPEATQAVFKCVHPIGPYTLRGQTVKFGNKFMKI